MSYKTRNLDELPRIACAKCHRSMPDHGGGFKTCASCTYGPSFGRSSADARAAVEAHAKRERMRVVEDDDVEGAMAAAIAESTAGARERAERAEELLGEPLDAWERSVLKDEEIRDARLS